MNTRDNGNHPDLRPEFSARLAERCTNSKPKLPSTIHDKYLRIATFLVGCLVGDGWLELDYSEQSLIPPSELLDGSIRLIASKLREMIPHLQELDDVGGVDSEFYG